MIYDAVTMVLAGFAWAVFAYFIVVNGCQTALLVSAMAAMRRHRQRVWQEDRVGLLGSAVTPTISALAPAYNEEANVAESVQALMMLQYPALEVVLINDGSGDSTLDVLIRTFDLYPIHPIFRNQVQSQPVRGLYRSTIHPQLLVVDKENGGKADALNAGLNCATGELVCAIDADTLIEPDALLRIVRPFLTDENVVAAGGTIRVANGSIVAHGRVLDARVPRGLLAGCQTVEYLRSFLFGRLGWNNLGGNLIISGAFGLFRRESVMAVGGYVHDTVGEDMELIADLRRRGQDRGTASRVDFVPDPVAWTEVPESLRVLGRQRDRWHRGLTDVLRRHRGVMFNPRYRALGLAVYPYYLVVELLGPVVEALGLVAVPLGLVLGAVDVTFAVLFLAVAYGWGVLLNVAVIALEELTYRRYQRWRDLLLLLLWSVVEGVGYRQLTVFWRLQGTLALSPGPKGLGRHEPKRPRDAGTGVKEPCRRLSARWGQATSPGQVNEPGSDGEVLLRKLARLPRTPACRVLHGRYVRCGPPHIFRPARRAGECRSVGGRVFWSPPRRRSG